MSAPDAAPTDGLPLRDPGPRVAVPAAPDATRLAIVLASGLVCAVWSHLYDRWQLPPRFDSTPLALTLGGDVLPLLGVPLVFVWLVLREPASTYGWRWRPFAPMLRDAFGAWLALLPLVLFFTTLPEVQAAYPSPVFPPARLTMMGVGVNLVLHIAPQMLATDFLYRGYLFLPLARRLGFVTGVVVMLVPYVALHLAKPGPELVLAAAGGVAFAWVAWRHQSFVPAFLAHWLVAATTDVFSFLQLHARP